ncbi:hypothetical protein EV189_2679 [Motilibacter rhizosphaerae]|uniref:Cytokinin riboside 5'-monophosphate phosphoribohydrolase n=1 Tax=Motilibacter rhizosphaerae TaxID=598652 RepID=A0A4Q7NPL7_9ACTN|nr:TIGR00730 family Rossman fold protein [Motilibacter rhizosphaerae]RZS87254.1 hypothetical protein EV189_2679 [Motilibacter rhizosphaerae]
MAAICVFCASAEAIDESYKELAAEVGTQIARRGHSLVSGGGRVSMMGRVARAARAGGARTYGVIPRALHELEVGDTDSDELVLTDTMRERKALMDEHADAFLALPGGIGTLEELFEIWVARSLGMHSKPVVVLDPDGTYAPLREQVELLAQRGFVRPEALHACHWATTPEEALDTVERVWAEEGHDPSRERAVEEMLEADL